MTSRSTIGVDDVLHLYWKYADDLAAARGDQYRVLKATRRIRPRSADIECEIGYLLVRERRPAHVVEIGSGHGWSTMWLLRALSDNGAGLLTSYDRKGHAVRSVPPKLAAGRWVHHCGPVQAGAGLDPARIDHLLIHAEHTAAFASWYVGTLLTHLRPGTMVCVHGVHRQRYRPRTAEARVLLDWLARQGIRHFTASSHAAPEVFDEIRATKRSLGLGEVLHRAGPNSMVFFAIR